MIKKEPGTGDPGGGSTTDMLGGQSKHPQEGATSATSGNEGQKEEQQQSVQVIFSYQLLELPHEPWLKYSL